MYGNSEDFLHLDYSAGLACMSPGMPSSSFPGPTTPCRSDITDLWGTDEDDESELPALSSRVCICKNIHMCKFDRRRNNHCEIVLCVDIAALLQGIKYLMASAIHADDYTKTDTPRRRT